jgi:transposase
VRQWAKDNNIIFVWTPTNASWLNRIECQFTELKQYSLDNTFFKTHAELQQTVKKFLRYRNARNKKKKKSLP